MILAFRFMVLTFLLIAPQGIEISMSNRFAVSLIILLIAPQGIEMLHEAGDKAGDNAF